MAPGSQNVIDFRGRQALRSKKVNTEYLPDKSNEMFDSGRRESPKKKKKRSIDASISTSVGSTERQNPQVMLPRDHGMTKDQLIAKVHKEMQSVLEFMAMSHDKLGNGYAAFVYVAKKMNP